MSPKSAMATALAYGCKRWDTLSYFFDEGATQIDQHRTRRDWRRVWKPLKPDVARRPIAEGVSMQSSDDLARFHGSHAGERVDMACLVTAIEACWDHNTAYQGITRPGNPAFGQCYPTSRVVQWFYPEVEIAFGDVWTGSRTECHFWNIRGSGDAAEWIDLSWKQFPPGSIVQQFKILDRMSLADSQATVERCALLLRRVLAHLASQ